MKSGIDYFPLDVVLDDKFSLIEAEYGLKGWALVIKLLQRIYGGDGYYCAWSDEVALLFAKQNGVGKDVVLEVMQAALRREIFNRDMFDKHKILTSEGVQRRYFEATSRRKELAVIGDYLLIDPTLKNKNVNIIGENVYIEQENANISQQSKVKESKEKKSTGEERKGEYLPADAENNPFSRFFTAYPRQENREAAQQEWVRLSPDESLAERLYFQAVGLRVKHLTDKTITVPLAADYLRSRAWEKMERF